MSLIYRTVRVVEFFPIHDLPSLMRGGGLSQTAAARPIELHVP